jgi:hypothetical protein
MTNVAEDTQTAQQSIIQWNNALKPEIQMIKQKQYPIRRIRITSLLQSRKSVKDAFGSNLCLL